MKSRWMAWGYEVKVEATNVFSCVFRFKLQKKNPLLVKSMVDLTNPERMITSQVSSAVQIILALLATTKFTMLLHYHHIFPAATYVIIKFAQCMLSQSCRNLKYYDHNH